MRLSASTAGSILKKLLKSKNRSQNIQVTQDDVVFLTRPKGSSYKNAAGIIRSLKDTLQAEGI